MTNAHRSRDLRAAIAQLEKDIGSPVSLFETLKVVEGIETLSVILAGLRLNGLVRNLEAIQSVGGGERSAKRLEHLIVLAKALERIQVIALDTVRGLADDAEANAEAERR